jgi:hypothetical protein
MSPLEQSADKAYDHPCDRYSAADYSRYNEERMAAEEVILFEKHSHECPACLKGIYENYQEMADKQDQRENETLLKKTYDLLSSLDKTSADEL